MKTWSDWCVVTTIHVRLEFLTVTHIVLQGAVGRRLWWLAAALQRRLLEVAVARVGMDMAAFDTALLCQLVKPMP